MMSMGIRVYTHLLTTDCKILKNKKFMGLAEEQNVRRKSKPSIVECEKYTATYIHICVYISLIWHVTQEQGI